MERVDGAACTARPLRAAEINDRRDRRATPTLSQESFSHCFRGRATLPTTWRTRWNPDSLASFLDASATEVRDAFTPEGLAAAVRLMTKYADPPMDFPDATLVWIAEQTGTDSVLTLDRRGFSSFRFGKSRRFKLLLDA